MHFDKWVIVYDEPSSQHLDGLSQSINKAKNSLYLKIN